MTLTPKNLIILLVLIGAGYWAYTQYGSKIQEMGKMDTFQQADAFFTVGDFDKAIPAYRAALAEKPDDPRAAKAMLWLAKAIDQDKRANPTGQAKEAVDAYKAFIAKYPTDPGVEEAKKRIDQREAMGLK